MSLTLDATLQTAQDSQAHKMILDLKSKPLVADIPFVGEFLTSETDDEQTPNTIMHSTGRMYTVYVIEQSDIQNLKFVYTDTERQEFTHVTIAAGSFGLPNYDFLEASIVEISPSELGVIALIAHPNRTWVRLYWGKISLTGTLTSYGMIEEFSYSTWENILSPYVIKLANGTYFLAYLKGRAVEINSSGTYTGSTNGRFEILITQTGSETTAWFKWRKDAGAWSAEIQCTGAAQLLQEGVSITFPANTYYEGMLFQLSVIAATAARGYAEILQNPITGHTITIGSVTYTFIISPLVGGGNPDEVAIDILSYEITLQDLDCAIRDTSYEGTGEGVRYGTGTAVNPDVTSERAHYRLNISAKLKGVAGNSLTLTQSDSDFTLTAFSGGADAVIGTPSAQISSNIITRTSNDFETWSAESIINPSGTGAREKQHVTLEQIDTGDVWLSFDNFDSWNYSNIYYITSTDNGSSWGAATAMTTYNSALAGGLHLQMIQKTATRLYAVFYEKRGALHIDQDSPGFPGIKSSVTNLHIYNGKIYALCTNASLGTKFFYCLIEVDITDWLITNSWLTTGYPAFDTYFTSHNIFWDVVHQGGGYFAIIGNDTNGYMDVLDIEANAIKRYRFEGDYRNVDWDRFGLTMKIKRVYIDGDNDRAYIVFSRSIVSARTLCIGSIDLTETISSGEYYTFTEHYYSTGGSYFNDSFLDSIHLGDFRVYTGQEIAVLTSQPVIVTSNVLFVFFTNTDPWTIDLVDIAELPGHGLAAIEVIGAYIYGVAGQYEIGGNVGLLKIDWANETLTNIIPDWPTIYANYYFTDMVKTDSNQLIISSTQRGITLFEPETQNWTKYTNDTLLGFTPSGDDNFICVVYDDTTDMIFGGVPNSPTITWEGLVGFSVYGYLRQSKYRDATWNGATWVFEAADTFIQGLIDFEAICCVDPDDNGVYVFWTNLTGTEYSIKWAKETEEFDFLPFLLRSGELTLKWTIENKPYELQFALSHGHLFDPFNEDSLYRQYVAKGHKVEIKIGEEVSGANYWQNQGTFLVTERKMITYKRGEYPTIKITCHDKRYMWDDMEVRASAFFEQDGDLVLRDIVHDDAGEELTDIDIPIFDNTTTIYVQFIDMTVSEIISQICNRYGYFPKIDINDDFTCRKISDKNDVDHVYTDNTKLIQYTPDDSFSDYTNRIIVTCEDLKHYESLFTAEIVGEITGTAGYWGMTKYLRVRYDPTEYKRIRNPFLKKISPIEGMMFELAGKVSVEIDDPTASDLYVDITIKVPDLRPLLVATIFAYIVALQSDYAGAKAAQAVAIALILNILASIVHYRYEIWGSPVGYVRKSWEAQANDDEMQTLCGKVIKKTIEEPLAYYIDEALVVAEHEIMILKLQRKRIKISKLGHLQDEVGDTITIKHPYSGKNLNIFITDLTRKLKMAERPEGDGYFIDEIEGWKL